MSLFGEFESLFSKGGLARMAGIRKGRGREIEGARPRASEEGKEALVFDQMQHQMSDAV